MPTSLHIDALRRLIGRALSEGAERVTLMRTRWDLAGNCSNPWIREVHSRPEARSLMAVSYVEHFDEEGDHTKTVIETRMVNHKTINVGHHTQAPLLLELHTRCRRCDNCRRARANLWRVRAHAETLAAPRTWFGTITIKPEIQHRFLAQARSRLRVQGVDFDTEDHGAQFRLRHAEANRELTLAIKRLREQTPSPFRYLLVCEQHKSGLPHYHMLLHEVDAGQPVRHALLAQFWPHGFTKWKLIEEAKQASYITKYLAKSLAARVRASQGYGDTTTYGHSRFRTDVNIKDPPQTYTRA